MRYSSVDDMLADVRSRLERVGAAEAASRVADGAMIVDIRPVWQRAGEGEVPGSVIVERNHLEWRLHPTSSARIPQARDGQEWIVICAEGYTSSLAADALNSLGIPATDIVGGYVAWREGGLPTAPGCTPADQVVPTTSRSSSDSTA